MDPDAYTFPPEPRDWLTVDEDWINNVPPKDSPYWLVVHKAARALKSDGCTGVKDYYVEACLEHDVHWRSGRTVFGAPITTAQANTRFRKVIQSRSRLGRFSLLSWIRWTGVTLSAPFMDHKST